MAASGKEGFEWQGAGRSFLGQWKYFFVLLCICQDGSELKVRLLHSVKNYTLATWPPLTSSNSSTLALPPRSPTHLATMVAGQLLNIPSPFWPWAFARPTYHPPSELHAGPRPCPLHRGSFLALNVKALPRHSHLLLCFHPVGGTCHFLLFSYLLSASAPRKQALQE